ncbi:MAG: lipocalin family protein [Huintestinicola sp.]
MKKIICLLLGMLMLTMTACGKSEEEKMIIGTWKRDNVSYESYLIFNEDMTCTETTSAKVLSSDVSNTKNGTYEIKNGTLVIYFNGKMEYAAELKFEDDKMIWPNIIEDIVYVRE